VRLLMQNLTDYNFSQESSVLADKLIGFVLVPNSSKSVNDRDDEDKGIGAYIPQLMSQIEMKSGPWDKNTITTSNMIKNSNIPISFESVNQRNYFNLTPHRISNIEQPFLAKGEHFYCQFIDGDIKKGKYLPELVNEKNRETDRFKAFVSSKGQQYEFVMDSEDQFIKLNLQKSSGEVSGYKLQMDGKNGELKITDDKEQGTSIDSKTNTVTIKADDTIVSEVSGYKLEINSKSGNISMSDDQGQGIFIDSASGTVRIKAINVIDLDAPTVT